MTAQPKVEARVTHRFAAPPAQLFDAFLDPAKVAHWMLAGGGEIVRITVDPQVGGRFSFVVRRGAMEIDHVGTYLELDRPLRLLFTWGVVQDKGDVSRIIIDIVQQESGCEVSLVHEMDAEWAEFVPSAQGAWTKMLGRIAEALA